MREHFIKIMPYVLYCRSSKEICTLQWVDRGQRLQMMMHFMDRTYFKLFDASLTVITKKLICTSYQLQWTWWIVYNKCIPTNSVNQDVLFLVFYH